MLPPHQALHYSEMSPRCREEIDTEPSKGTNDGI